MTGQYQLDMDEARPGATRLLIGAAFLIVSFALHGNAAADVLLKSDFSSTTWYTDWQDNENIRPFTKEPPGTKRISADATTAGFEALDGSALQVTIRKGENFGTGLSFYPRVVLGHDPVELYLRYYLRFGSDWNNVTNGKLPGFGGTYDIGGWGGKVGDGSSGWSARGKFGDPCANDKIAIGSYVYHADMDGQYGDSFTWTNGCSKGLNRNQWYSIEYYVKLNSLGRSDGVLRGWIDGQQVMERSGLRFDVTGDFKIERVWMNVYHGGGPAVAPQDLHVFFDDVVVADHYIGPRDAMNEPVPPDPVAPKPPPELRVE